MRVAAELPPTSTRVERNSDPELNERIRTRANARIAALEGAAPDELEVRLAELDREWDIERVLQANASTLVILGTILGLSVDHRFLLLPTAVLSFFLQHALQGWCPPVPFFRRNGVRTRREIERERYAVKLLRGDFERVPSREAGDAQARVQSVLQAIDA